MNLRLKETYNSGTRPEEWPRPLAEEERKAVLSAADAAGRDAFCVVAAMLYMGLRPNEAADIPFRRAVGDAIEINGRFLHIPAEYKNAVLRKFEGVPFLLNQRLTDYRETDAAAAAVAAFDAAGLDTAGAWLRLRRTAAQLHYMYRWTRAEDIERWFSETRRMNGYLKEVYYNPEAMRAYDSGTIDADGVLNIEAPDMGVF